MSQMDRPLLFTYRRCPYAMRARMALLQARIDFDPHEIVLRAKPAAMMELSPKGTVPVLVLPDGSVLDESLDIMRWALCASDSAAWWTRSQSGAGRAFIQLNDGPFKVLLDRYKYPERSPSNEDPAFHRDAAVSCMLTPLDQLLAGQQFLAGDEPCAADLAVFPFVRQFRGVDEAWFDAQALPHAQRWLMAWLQSDLFQRCMKKAQASSTSSSGLA